MPRNGSGVYSLPGGINPVVTQTLITSNWANTTMNDLAAAITASIARDGQSPPTANLPMANFRHTGVSDPTLRNQYASLAVVQDGRHLRLTNVVGVNTITADLLGGSTSLVVGQIVQLIPSSNNTGATTLTINSDGAKRIITDIGSELSAGNLVAGRPYLLSYNGTDWTIIAGGGASSGIAQSAMSGWDRPTINGPYPELTIVNPTTVHVPAGTGRIIRPSARDLAGVTEVSWAAQDVTITNVAATWTTVLGVDASGNIVQFTGGLNPAWARTTIQLGTVAHINGVINDVITRPAIFGDMTYASYDVSVLLHNTLISGGRIFPNGSSPLHVDLSAGSLFSLGADSDEVNSPNIVDFPDQLDVQFFPITGISGVGALTQNVPVTSYDPAGAGVVSAIPGGASTTAIHRLYFLAGQFLFLYGQNTYPDLDTALNQIGVDDAATIFPAKLVNATLLGYIVAQKNCIDLSDPATARLIPKGGNSFAIGSSGSISEAPINGLTYGRRDASWTEVINALRGNVNTLRMIPGYTSSSQRWAFGLDDTPEGGSNTGTDYQLRAYNDAGTLLGTAFRVERSTQKTYFAANPEIANAAATLSLNRTTNAADDRRAAIGVNINGGVAMYTQDDALVQKSALILADNGGLSVTGPGGVSLINYDPTTGTVQRDMTGASTRLKFQTNVADGISILTVLPNGTATDSLLQVHNGSDVLNSGSFQFRRDASRALLNSSKTGTGVTHPIVMTFENVERWRLLTDGTVQADYTNLSTRCMFQSSVTNGSSNVNAKPNGTSVTAGFGAWNSSDPLNASLLQMYTASTTVHIQSTKTGTGVTRDLVFQMDSAEVGRMTTAGTFSANDLYSVNGLFFGSTTQAVLAPNSATGQILLRPKGVASAVGQLQIANTGNVTVNGTLTSTGNISFPGGTFSASFTANGITNNSGINFGGRVAASATDLSEHIQLHTSGYGFNIQSSRMNAVVPSSTNFFTVVNGVDVVRHDSVGVAVKVANSTAFVRIPRIFVQASDPGAAAADGDLWFW